MDLPVVDTNEDIGQVFSRASNLPLSSNCVTLTFVHKELQCNYNTYSTVIYMYCFINLSGLCNVHKCNLNANFFSVYIVSVFCWFGVPRIRLLLKRPALWRPMQSQLEVRKDSKTGWVGLAPVLYPKNTKIHVRWDIMPKWYRRGHQAAFI